MTNKPSAAAIHAGSWWLERRDALLALADEHESAWVYDRESVRAAVRSLTELASIDRVLYAMKANFNPQILRLLASLDVDFECVSPGEVMHLRASLPDLPNSRILFTPNFAPRGDYEWALGEGLCTTLDNLHPLRCWPELFADKDLLVRIDTGIGRGHHDHVVTSGEMSKFGIPRFEVDELVERVNAVGARVIGVHTHSGSGIAESDTWGSLAAVLAEVAERFPTARALDLGGGLSVAARPDDTPFDLTGMDRAVAEVRRRFPKYDIWVEPGRYLVAESGVLMTRVTQLKGKGDRRYVGVATGMNALIRPSLYDAYHEIVNLTRVDSAPVGSATVVGPICETGDTLGHDRLLPECEEGDVMLILTAGAYGRVMSSSYNLRPLPPEIVLDD